MSWRPSHSDVVYRLLDFERQSSGRYYRDFLSELDFYFGGGYGRADLVIIERGRSVGGKRGKTLSLYEVKTEYKDVMRVVFEACRQIELYKLGLMHPEVFILDREKAEKVKDALGFSTYLVVQEDLWEERLRYSKEDLERLDKLLKYYKVGLIIYNRAWEFKYSKDYVAFLSPLEIW